MTVIRRIFIILLISLFCTGVIYAESSPWEDDEWLKSCLLSGNLDTLRIVLDRIPEQTAPGQLFRGLFESDGEKARYFYDRAVALYPGSDFEAFALERLWQYHWTKGDAEMANRYWDFLKRRHPEFHGLENPPAFSQEIDLKELSRESIQVYHQPDIKKHRESADGKMWTIQLGAFRNPDGAKRVGQDASRFEKVRYIKKEFNGQVLTVVQLGRFRDRRDAEALDERIRTSTEMRGRVVEVKDQ